MADPNKSMDEMERLFLLELLIDNVDINYEKIGIDAFEICNLKQACVRFQFLNYPVLEICEEDFCNNAEEKDKNHIEFKSGKSCLFSLRGIPPDQRCFEICVTVLRQKSAGSCVLLGRTRINLGSSFTNILTAMDNDSSTGPVARTSKDTHPLLNEKGEIVGKITVFIRLSCFGKMIITQFQVSGEENKSFLFKGGSEVKALSDLGPAEQSVMADPFARGTPGGEPGYSSQTPQSRGYAPATEYSEGGQQLDVNIGEMGMSGDVGMATSANYQMMAGSYQGMPGMMTGMPGTAGSFPGSMPGGVGSMPGVVGSMPAMGGSMPGMLTGMPWAIPGMAGSPGVPGVAPGMPGNVPGLPALSPGMTGEISGECDYVPDKNYKEIGVEINGQSLNIKIPRRPKKPKADPPPIPFCGKIPIASSDSESDSSNEEESVAPSQQEAQQQVPGIQFCGCDYPLPPGFSCPPPPPPPKKKKKKKKPKCPMELKGNYCMKPDCPMGYPTFPCGDKKPGCPQFEIPPGAVGFKGEQITFQMPSGNQNSFQPNTNAFYNFGGNVDTNLQKVQMMSDVDAEKTVKPDPRNDVFLLKVGKKNIATDRMARMEVEIKSPRKEELKMVDNYSQYLETDIGPVEVKKGGMKGGKKGVGKVGMKGGKKGVGKVGMKGGGKEGKGKGKKK